MLNKKMLSLIFCVASFSLSAMEPAAIKQEDKSNEDRPSVSIAKHSNLERGSAVNAYNRDRTPISQYMQSTGSVKVLVLLLEFADYQHSEALNSRDAIENKIFGEGNPAAIPMDSLKNFYSRSSYDKLDLQGSVLDWYQTEANRPAHTDVWEPDVATALMKEAIEYHKEQGHDFSQYDNDGDGEIDFVFTIWAGPSQSWGLWSGQAAFFWDQDYKVDGKSLHFMSWLPVSDTEEELPFSPRATINGLGLAMGLPDLYDYNSSTGLNGGVGALDMMGNDKKYDHNSFSKFLLGWITPQLVSGNEKEITLRPFSEYPDAVLFKRGATESTKWDEYYLAEYRKRSGNDLNLPGEGLVIWHVDAKFDHCCNFNNDNNFSEHKLVRLVQADGLEQIELKGAKANQNDFFTTGDELSPLVAPYTYLNNGEHSGVVIKNIKVNQDNITLTSQIFSPTPKISVTGIEDMGRVSIGQTMTIEVESSANNLEKIEVYIDDSLHKTFTQAPYQLTLTESLLTPGSHDIKVVASNIQGAQSAQHLQVAYLENKEPTNLFINFAPQKDELLAQMIEESGLAFTYMDDFVLPLTVEEFPVVHLNFGFARPPYNYVPESVKTEYNEYIQDLSKVEVDRLIAYLTSGGKLLIEGEKGLANVEKLADLVSLTSYSEILYLERAFSNELYDNKSIDISIAESQQLHKPNFVFDYSGEGSTNVIMTAVGMGSYDLIEHPCVMTKPLTNSGGKLIVAQCISDYFTKREDKANLFNTYLDYFGIDTKLQGNSLPQATAGAAQTVVEGTTVNLAATAYDADEDDLTYSWKQLTGPQITIINPSSLTASFVAPEVAEETNINLQLTVSDGVAEATSQVTITVQHVNKSPVLTVGSDQTVKEGDTVTLVATATDADGSELSIQWIQTSGIQVTLTGEQTLSPSFTAPEVSQNETLTFEVSVSDGEASVSNVIRITVQDSSVVTPTPNTSTGNTSSGTNTGNTSSATPSSSSGGSGGGSLGGYLLGLLSLMVVAQRRRRSV